MAVAMALHLPTTEAAADPLDARTQGMLAFVAGQRDTAFKLLSPLAATEDRDVLWALGVMYANGEGPPRNFEQAMALFLAAARLGQPDSHYDIGVMYELGEGRTPDPKLAQEWYMKGVAIGCAPCALNAGWNHVLARTSEDWETAEELLSLAAREGDTLAKLTLGRLLITRDPMGPIDRTAQLFADAADMGRIEGEYMYAQLRWHSLQSPRDARLGVDAIRTLLAGGRMEELFIGYQAELWLMLTRSAMQGWGMKQDLSVALSYASQLDAVIGEIRSNAHLEHSAAFYAGIYPVHDLVKSLIGTLGDLRRGSGDIDCAAAAVLKNAAIYQMLPVDDAQLFLAAAHRMAADGADCSFISNLIVPEQCGNVDDAGMCQPAILSAEYLQPSMDDSAVPIRFE